MGVVTKLQNIRAEDVEKNQSQVWLVTFRHAPRLIQLSTAQNVLATMRYVDAMLKLCGYLEGISQLRTPLHIGVLSWEMPSLYGEKMSSGTG